MHLIQTLAVIVILVPLTGLSTQTAEAADYLPDELVCQVTDSAYIGELNQIYTTTTKAYLPLIGGFLLQTEPGVNVDSLSTVIIGNPSVIYCSPNFLADAPEGVQGSQPFIDLAGTTEVFLDQPAVSQLAIAPAQAVSSGSGVKVGVIDVGIDAGHPVLEGVVTPGYDFVDGDASPLDVAGGRASGHGTFIAGVINLVAPEAEILAYRVLDTSGRGNGFTLAEAILQAVADSCRVINLSMVMGDKHGTVDGAIEYAHNHNVLVIAAGGNDGIELERFPATDSYVMGVASLDSTNLKSPFATYHQKLDIAAPGTRVYGPYLDSTYAWWDGSSFAAPFVAGQAALILSRRPQLAAQDVEEIIMQSAVNIDGLNSQYAGMLGAGVIDVDASLAVAGIICGDVDQNGVGPDIGDATALIDNLFINFTPLPDPALADLDGVAGVDIADLTALLRGLFITFEPLDCTP